MNFQKLYVRDNPAINGNVGRKAFPKLLPDEMHAQLTTGNEYKAIVVK